MFFLANDNDPAGKAYNDCMFLDIVQWIQSYLVNRPLINVLGDVRKALNQFIPQCVDNKSAEWHRESVFLEWIKDTKEKDTKEKKFSPHGLVRINAKREDLQVRQVPIPRGLVTGILSPGEQIPPHVIYKPTSTSKLYTVVVDLPGVRPETLEIKHRPKGVNVDLEIRARRESDYECGGRPLTPSLGGKDAAIFFGSMAITVPLTSDLRLNFKTMKWTLANGCLTINYESKMAPSDKGSAVVVANPSPAVEGKKPEEPIVILLGSGAAAETGGDNDPGRMEGH